MGVVFTSCGFLLVSFHSILANILLREAILERGELDSRQEYIKVAPRFSGVNFVSLNFIDYVSMALCMGDNRVGDTSDLLDLPQEMGLARRGSF